MKFAKKKPFYEAVCFLLLPLVLWLSCRGIFGDYWTMLLSTAPGFIYTIFTTFVDKQFNITGLCAVIFLSVYAVLNIIAKTAEGILWNGVYINLGLAIFWILTIIIRKPMAMYFFIDMAYLRGIPRASSRKLFAGKKPFRYSMWFTAFFLIRDVADIILRIFLINKYGVDGYHKIILITQIWNWFFIGLTILIITIIISKIADFVKQLKTARESE